MAIDWGSVFSGKSSAPTTGSAGVSAPRVGTGKINWGSMFQPKTAPAPVIPHPVGMSSDRMQKWQDLYTSATPDVQASLQTHIEKQYKANPTNPIYKQQYDALFGANKALLKSGAKPEVLPETSSIGQSQALARGAAKGIATTAVNLAGGLLPNQSAGESPGQVAKLRTAQTTGNYKPVGNVGHAASNLDIAKTAIIDKLTLGKGIPEVGEGSKVLETASNFFNKGYVAKIGADQVKDLPGFVKAMKDPNITPEQKSQLLTQTLAGVGLTAAAAHGAVKEGISAVNDLHANALDKATPGRIAAMNDLINTTELPAGKGTKSAQLAAGEKPLALPSPSTKELPSGGVTTPGGATTIKSTPTVNNGPATVPASKKVAAIDKQLSDFKTNPNTTMTPEDAKALQQQRFQLSNQPVLDHIATTHAAETGVPVAQAHQDIAAGKGDYSDLYKTVKDATPTLANERGGLPIEKLPGVGDLTHAVKTAKAAASELIDTIHPKFDAKAKDIFYKARGEGDFAKYKAHAQLDEARNYFNKTDLTGRKNFVQAIMTGKVDQLPAVEQKHAAFFGQMLDDQLKKEQPYIATARRNNYFPTSGIWDKAPNEGALAANGKSIGGNKSFLKDKVFANLKEGEAAGGSIRKDFNPVDLVERRIGEGTKAMELVKNLQEAEKTGLASREAKPGLVRSNDPALKGWWMHPDLAKMIERHNSTNFFTDTHSGRQISAIKNSGTAIKLALSGAHAIQSTIGGIYDHMGLGLQKLLSPRGSGVNRLEGLGNVAASPVQPVLAMIKEIGGFSDKEIHDFYIGGGKKGAEAQYKQGFGSAAQAAAEGEYLRAGLKGLSTANQKLLEPLFDHYIPGLKVSSVADRIAYETQLRAKDIASGKVSAEEIARNAVKQADQTFGEYNYDNFHMNNTLKGVAQFATRALGWTYGNLAQLGKGAVKTPGDLLFNIPRGLITGGGKGLSPEAAKLWSLAFTVGTIGAVYQQAHTGQWPTSAQDFFEPKNGQKDANGKDIRVTFLNPINDVLSIKRNVSNYGVVQGTGKFLGGKEADALSIMASLISNKDYLGNYVYDPKAGWVQKGKELAGFIGKGAQPISIGNAQDKNNKVNPVENFLGINKASSLDSRTPLEQQIYQGLNDKFGSNPKTPQQAKDASDLAAAVADLRAGKSHSPAIDSLTAPEFTKAKEKAKQTPLQYDFSLLNSDQKVKILESTDAATLKREGIKADTLVKDFLTSRSTTDSLTAKGYSEDRLKALVQKLGYTQDDYTRIVQDQKKAASVSRKASAAKGKFKSFLLR